MEHPEGESPQSVPNHGTRHHGVLRTLHEHRREIGLAYRRLASIIAVAIIASLAQAATLVVIVRLATAITTGEAEVSGSVGLLSIDGVTRGQLVTIALVLTLVALAGELLVAWLLGGLQAQSQRVTQARLLTYYTDASLDAQLARSRGDMHQLLFNHTAQITAAVGSLGRGASSLTSFVVLVGTSLILSPLAALVVVIGLLVVLAAIRPIVVLSRRANRDRAVEQRRLGGDLGERLELSREIATFGVGAVQDAALCSQVDEVARLTHRRITLTGSGSAVYRAGALLIVTAALWTVDVFDFDNLTALTGALLLLLRSMSYGQAAQSTYQSLSDSLPIVEQLTEEIERLTSAAQTNAGRSATPSHVGDVQFHDVSYSYDAHVPALRNVDLTIPQGSLVAMVGRSGAGKSTAMQLVLGARFATSGAVTFDGIDIATISEHWLRQHVAYVPQEPRLKSGSIRDAIRFLRDGISDAEVEAAADRAHIGHEIRTWQRGFDTEVGQLGDRLSGGQRQRLAIARALAGSPQLLLLDEPTSALDIESTLAVARTIDELRGTMTIVVIAHRPETVRRADRVVIFDDGLATEHSDTADVDVSSYFDDPSAPERTAGT